MKSKMNAEPDMAQQNSSSPSLAAESEAESPGVPSMNCIRILLVDDHEDTCAALEKLLVRRGHRIVTAHNVESALEAARRDSFDLLISDAGLPDGTGADLMTRLRAVQPVPGVAISGFGMNGDVQKSLAAGFSTHLIKPITFEQLEEAIARTINGAAGGS